MSRAARTTISQAIIDKLIADIDNHALIDVLINYIHSVPDLQRFLEARKKQGEHYFCREVEVAFIETLTDYELLEIEQWGEGDTCTRDAIYSRMQHEGIQMSLLEVLRKHYPVDGL